MKFWLALTADFVLQEPVSSTALILYGYQTHKSLLAMHLVFVLATAFDAAAGYWIGSYLMRRFPDARISRWLVRRGQQFDAFAGTTGKRAALLIWGPNAFPLSAFIAPWFGYSFTENLVLSLIGDAILWYGAAWLVVLGVHTFVPNPVAALFVVSGVSLLLMLGLRSVARRRK